MPVDPFTYDHQEHSIDIYGHDCPADCDFDHCRAVTVAELLDAQDKRHDNPRHFIDLAYFASEEVAASVRRVRTALNHYRALSPSERAEFDRRTT